MRHVDRPLLVFALVVSSAAPLCAAGLEDRLGRSEMRVRSEAFPLVAGRSVADYALAERLERQGYHRVSGLPDEPGEYFWGDDVFWFYRREHRLDGHRHAPSRIGLALDEHGVVIGARGMDGSIYPLDQAGVFWLEPEILAESLAADRADRTLVDLAELPERIWRPVLAAEDTRFFLHDGVDGMAIARAALANFKKGETVQGGSTITQQLVKNRDLTPKRSFSRKLSEAARALVLEAEYEKREILEAYLNQVYLGHVDGLALHGIGTASLAYFSKPARDLDWHESATLAAMIQGPNRLSPLRHPERVIDRRNWVLGRLWELDWIGASELRQARAAPIGLRLSEPSSDAPRHFLDWTSHFARDAAGDRLARGRGIVLETTLDPFLQALAEKTVLDGLAELRRRYPRLRGSGLQAALVAVDAADGAVRAYVGGDPAVAGDKFDRVRRAERQPGSTVKPLVLLEAFDSCGSRSPLNPSSRVLDRPLSIELPSGDWRPENFDGRYQGVVDTRTVLEQSRNVPLVRIARYCGFKSTAALLRKCGLAIPEDPPPAFALGALETTPLGLAGAYTVIATPGRFLAPFPVTRIELPKGRPVERFGSDSDRVVGPATAWLVRDLMRGAVERGTARAARIPGLNVAAKTGSSSELRDSWFAGDAEALVTVVWVGLDDGTPLGLTGARAAGPIWNEFTKRAVTARPRRSIERPGRIVEDWVDPETGLRERKGKRGTYLELFRKGALPPRNRRLWIDRAVPVIE